MNKGREVGLDKIAREFESYEDYLDSQITDTDLFYLEDEELARKLVEFGFRGNVELFKREDFERKRKECLHSSNEARLLYRALDHEGLEITEPCLVALAEREEINRRGNLSTIIFIRDINNKGREISGYIDYAHRLKVEDFVPYFSGKKKLLPRVGDLSYLNWDSQYIASSSSPNYKVIAENPNGLLFKNKRDRNIITIDPWSQTAGDNSTRTVIQTSEYKQFVLYDHITRRKT
ncbi:unnamed protein product [Rodentolepis nana]|uniref:Cilia- and flagella-associated protein 299 n=1 Tax=Rodentolepis nana TaxID=102285 RepID=A0A0R3TZ72_RODNA|nr:unnamed protein product [Rodentolepis nana]